MTKLIALGSVLMLAACGRKVVTTTHTVPGPIQVVTVEGPTTTVQGPTTTVIVEVPAAPVPLTEVQSMIADENDYRLSLGQLPLTSGLTCSLYNVANGATPTPPMPQPANFPTSLPSATSTFTYKGVFNQASGTGSQILPSAIRGLYVNWFAIRCQGSIVITDSGWHNFQTESDDASMLYIDNVLVVDNNGQHGMQVRQGAKQLHSGVHTFRLDYLAGNGPSGLIVNMDGGNLASELLFR